MKTIFFQRHEPWTAPKAVQESINCVLGVHYPERIVDLAVASARNIAAMNDIRNALIIIDGPPSHCRPSNEEEVRRFFWLDTNNTV